MKRILLFVALFFSFSHGATVTFKTVTFTDQEQNQTSVVLNYSSYIDFINLGFSGTSAGYILNCRNILTPTLTCVSNSGLVTSDLMRLREYSYLIKLPDQNTSMTQYNSLGIQVFQFNFLMALMGGLIGFAFAFFLVYAILNIGKKA